MPLEFLDGADAPTLDAPAIEAPAEAITAEATPEPQEPSAPQRGPDGKFVAKQAAEPPQEPAQAVSPEPAPVAAPEPQHAPLTALLDEREKRQAAETRAKALEEQLRRAQPRPEPQTAPDPYDDPEGFADFQQQQLDQRIYQTNLQWSRRIAEVQNGAELVGQAHEWGVQRCNEDPFFNQKVQTSPDPYGFVIAEWKREQLLTQVSDPSEFEQFRAWKASQGQGAAPIPAATPTPQQPVVRPPVSLASAPSAGGAAHVPIGAGRAYDSLFPQG